MTGPQAATGQRKRRSRERIELDAIAASLIRYERLLRIYTKAKARRRLQEQKR